MRAERHSFVGRLEELTEILAWRSQWLGAGAAAAPVALVSGAPGSGKSRLAREFAQRLPAHEMIWVEGTPESCDHPFLALASALDLNPRIEGSPGSRNRVGARFRVREQLIESLSERASQSPVLIVADDAQWIDSGSLETLLHSARPPGIDAGVGVLLLARPAAHPDLLAMRDDLLGIELPPLDERAALDLATIVLGRALSADESARIEGSDRSPLVIVETAARLRAQIGQTEPLHPSVAWMQLSEGAQRVARAGAVIGRRFMAEDLAAMLGGSLEAARASCSELMRLDVISVDPDKHMVFRHDVIREGILEQTHPEQLADLHSRRAHAIVTSGQNRAFDSVAVAQHLSQVAPTASAAARFADAGAALLGTDPAGAARFYQRALAIDLHPAPDVISGACQALIASNQADEALRLLAGLDPESLDGPLLVREAEATAALGELDLAAQCFERAASALGNNAAGQRALAEGQLVRALCFQHQTVLSNTEALLDEPTALDEEAEVHARCARAWVLKERGDIDAALEEADGAVDVAGGEPSRLWRNPQMYRLDVLVAADRYDELDSLAERARAVALEFGDVWQIPSLSSMLAGAYYRTGEWDRALAEIDAGRQWARETGDRLALPWLLSLRSAISGARGHVEEAEANVVEAERLVQEDLRSGAEAVLWSRALRCVADPEEAIRRTGYESLEALWQMLRELDVVVRASTIAPPLVRAAKELGEHRRCKELMREIADLDERRPGQLPALSAVRLAAEGLIKSDAGSLLDAAVAFGRLGLVPDQAAVLCDALELSGNRRTPRVRAAAVQAAQLIAELGDVHLSHRLPEWTLDSDVGETTAPDALADLSRAERRVAALVATGASNPSIAEELHISRRTVESHLSHIFAKLGIAGRVELALLAASPTSNR